jgi:hypothetical protein
MHELLLRLAGSHARVGRIGLMKSEARVVDEASYIHFARGVSKAEVDFRPELFTLRKYA